jgi:hypothetical protein
MINDEGSPVKFGSTTGTIQHLLWEAVLDSRQRRTLQTGQWAAMHLMHELSEGDWGESVIH